MSVFTEIVRKVLGRTLSLGIEIFLLLFTALLLYAMMNILYSSYKLSHLNGPSWSFARTSFLRRLLIGHDDLIHSLNFNDYGDLINSFSATFGPIFKMHYILGARLVYLASPEAVEHVLVKNANNYAKPTIMRMSLTNILGGQGLVLSEGDAHSRLRRIVAPAFHHEALLKLSGILFDEAKRMSDAWNQQLDDREGHSPESDNCCASIPVDVDDITGVQAVRVIMRSAFGTRVGEESRLYEEFRAHFVEAPPLWRLIAGVLIPSSRFDKYVAWGHGRLRFLRSSMRAIATKRKRVRSDNHAPSAAQRSDLLSLLLDAKENERILSEAELIDNMMTFLVAGTITTAMTMSWCIYNLAVHQTWQSKLYSELQDLVQSGQFQYETARDSVTCKHSDKDVQSKQREKELQSLDSLQNLDAFVRETLRLHTPVTNLVRTTISDDEILGKHIPKGTQVRIPLTAVHRSGYLGSSPTEFNPSRWLETNPSSKSVIRKAWFPFIYGSRGCIGQRLAMYEIKVHLAILLLRFKVLPAPGGAPEEPVGFLCKFKGGKVLVQRRTDDSLGRAEKNMHH